MLPFARTFDHTGDRTTWSRLVDTTALDDRRACIMCGDTTLNPHRSVPVATLLEELEPVHKDQVCAVIRNVANASACVYDTYGSKDIEARVVICMCCQHWINRRSKRKNHRRATPALLPLQALMSYVRTLQMPSDESDESAPGGGSVEPIECMDARVVRRLVVSLTQDAAGRPLNYYLTLFAESERVLFYSMRHKKTSELHNMVALHYHAANAHTNFFTTASAAEAVRVARTALKTTPPASHPLETLI